MSDIEWTNETLGVFVGCTRVSPGCSACYAERHAHRGLVEQHRGLTVLGKGEKGPRWTGEVRFVPTALVKALHWKKPRKVFVNSMSDVWHENATNEQIATLFGVMARTPHITYQILTKRPERMRAWFTWAEKFGEGYDLFRDDMPSALLTCAWEACSGDAWGDVEPGDHGIEATPDREQFGSTWPLPNVWIGVTAEDQQRADERIPLLLDTPAAVRFVSYEPALEAVDFHRSYRIAMEQAAGYGLDPGLFRAASSNGVGFNWLIVGGESGPKARPFNLAWARHALAQCRLSGVPAFFKQAGAKPYVCIGNHDNAGDGADVDCKGEAGFGCEVLKLKHGKGADLSELPTWARVREFPRGTP